LPALRATLLALLLPLAACGGVDVEQARLCERLIPALEQLGAAFVVTARETDATAAHAVLIRYRLQATDTAAEAPRWLSCRFAGGGFAEGRLRLSGVTTERAGALSEISVFLLRRYWLGLYESPQTPAATPQDRLLYALQLALNALNLGCLYGLLALGYTLVYGIARRINLAFGEIAMVGAYTTFLAVTALALLGNGGMLPLALLAVLGLVALVGAVHGWVTERLVFRPLHDQPSQAPLIATVGLALFLQEYLRLTQGAEDRWIQPVFSEAHVLAGSATAFAVTISTSQLLILALTAALYLALWHLMTRTAFGRAARACADDLQMASLCGVPVPRIMARTFTLGAACAAAAGFVILLRYGGVRFSDGFLLGFKALTAAILGGIGSLPGAMLGGLLIGALETFWAGYLTLAYKDVAVFALLAAVLIWRPHGLFGHPLRRANDRFRPPA
jgi:branched-chain amino acid transport system permease protein